MELSGGRQRSVSSLRPGTLDPRETGAYVQDPPAPYKIRAEITSAGRVCFVQLHNRLRYVLRAIAARGGPEARGNRALDLVDGNFSRLNLSNVRILHNNYTRDIFSSRSSTVCTV